MNIDDFTSHITKSVSTFDGDDPEAHCYLIKIEPKSLHFPPDLLDRLSNEERLYSQTLISTSKKLEFIYCRGALRAILDSYLKSEFQINTDENGKPFIDSTLISFNQSHSHKWLLIGVSNQGEIGVDIEEIIEIPEQDFIEHNFLQKFNDDYLIKYAGSYSDALINFYSRWTAVESLLKAIGRGLAFDDSLKAGSALPNISLFQKKMDRSYFMSAVVLFRNVNFKFIVINPFNNE